MSGDRPHLDFYQHLARKVEGEGWRWSRWSRYYKGELSRFQGQIDSGLPYLEIYAAPILKEPFSEHDDYTKEGRRLGGA